MSKLKTGEFAGRRKKVLKSLDDCVYIRLSHYEHTKNSDVHFNFRQDSSFFYLTGFPEADSLLVLDPQGDENFCMFVRPKDRTKEIWEGFRYGAEGTVDTFKADGTIQRAGALILDCRISPAADVISVIVFRQSAKRFVLCRTEAEKTVERVAVSRWLLG